jgi:dihydrolipoamide dehydrogenase
LIPSRAWHGLATDASRAAWAPNQCAVSGDVKMNVTKMMDMKNKTVKALTGGIEMLFKKNKVMK